MADAGLFDVIKSVIDGNDYVQPHLYNDEDSVLFPDKLGWKHGRNIPLAALVLAYRARLLKHDTGTAWTLTDYRNACLRYCTETGMGHGEEFSRIYSYWHQVAVSAIRKLAIRFNDPRLADAAYDWIKSYAGFLGITSWDRLCGSRNKEKYDSKLGPHVMVCDQLPRRDEVGNVQFGKRSWNLWDDKSTGKTRWVHLDDGGMYIAINNTLKDLLPEDRSIVVSAFKGEPKALQTCLSWAKNRLPNNHYIMARWSGGMAFWSPTSSGASTAPGELCVIYRVPGRSYDDIIFAATRYGFRNDFDTDATCNYDGEVFHLKNNKGKTLQVSRPTGELLFYLEIKDKMVIKEFIKGAEEALQPPVEYKPPAIDQPPMRPKKKSLIENIIDFLRSWFG